MGVGRSFSPESASGRGCVVPCFEAAFHPGTESGLAGMLGRRRLDSRVFIADKSLIALEC